MSRKEYRLRDAVPANIDTDLSVYPPILRKLLYYRGITEPETAEKFLNPEYDRDLHNPFLLKGMDKAVSRIIEAIEKNQKILIYSDYDADGIPGGVALRDFFENIGHKNVENYIPHRHDEGYGLHLEAVDQFKERGVELIITVDCGIADFDQVGRAQSLGIDVIITDHHEPNGNVPEAFAIINPKQKDCSYPEAILCGSGVVFKLIQGILSKNRFGLKEGREKWLLDLVGLATMSDMVPLTGENRALAFYGLKVLRKSPRPGLQQMWKILGTNQKYITEDDIGFSLAPRINAASRMGEPDDAFLLLKTKKISEAGMASERLNKINDERKGVVASLVKEIKKHIREREESGTLPSVLVFGNPNWRPSLLGLAGNSIMEDIRRPIFLWGRNGESLLKGSCRSDGETDMVALMECAKESLIQFGGHKMAGGFEVSHEKIHTLEESLNTAFKSLPKGNDSEDVFVESEISLEEVDWNLYSQIEKLAPFGVGNEKPKFLITNAKVSGVKQFGKEKNHLEISLETNGKPIKAISFFSSPQKYEIVPEEGKKINLVAVLEKSMFRNYPELRLRIVDII